VAEYERALAKPRVRDVEGGGADDLVAVGIRSRSSVRAARTDGLTLPRSRSIASRRASTSSADRDVSPTTTRSVARLLVGNVDRCGVDEEELRRC
jgi:hypothetical protein